MSNDQRELENQSQGIGMIGCLLQSPHHKVGHVLRVLWPRPSLPGPCTRIKTGLLFKEWKACKEAECRSWLEEVVNGVSFGG